jgi:hypothetical protein
MRYEHATLITPVATNAIRRARRPTQHRVDRGRDGHPGRRVPGGFDHPGALRPLAELAVFTTVAIAAVVLASIVPACRASRINDALQCE